MRRKKKKQKGENQTLSKAEIRRRDELSMKRYRHLKEKQEVEWTQGRHDKMLKIMNYHGQSKFRPSKPKKDRPAKQALVRYNSLVKAQSECWSADRVKSILELKEKYRLRWSNL